MRHLAIIPFLLASAPASSMEFSAGEDGNATFSINLTKGTDYAIRAYGWEGDSRSLELVNPLNAVTITLRPMVSPDEGREFRAAYTGTYKIRFTNAPNASGRLDGDCKTGIKTHCTLKLGQTLKNRIFTWVGDDDWLKLRLTAGRTYTFTYTTPSNTQRLPLGLLRIYNSTGRQLVTSAIENPITLRYRPRASGTYYLSVYNWDIDNGGFLYNISMK